MRRSIHTTRLSDVAAAVQFVRERGLPFTVRSSGQDFAGHSTSTGAALDVGAISQISVANGHTAVGAGARPGNVYRDLAGYGRTLPGGCGPTVGKAGLTIDGGLGVLGRRHGLLCDRLRTATIVLADGSVVQRDDDHDSGLFWALGRDTWASSPNSSTTWSRSRRASFSRRTGTA
jgi:FAD/FMN-containing dehydrogenase